MVTTTGRALPTSGGGSIVAVVLTVPVALLAMAPAAPVLRLGVGCFHPRDPGRVLVRDRLPPRGASERAPPCGDDGHAHLDRDARRLGLVVGRPARRDRGGHVLRGRRSDHDADPARPLPRGPREEPLERGDSQAARARREGGPRPARRRRGSHPDRGGRAGRPVRRPARREDRDGRRRRRGAVGDRPVDAHGRVQSPSKSSRAPRSRARRSTPTAASSCGQRKWEPIRRSRRSRASSRPRSRGRPRCSASRTASRRSSSRS